MKMTKKILIGLIAVLFVVGVALAAQININTADVNTLMTIKGIGQQKAQATVDYRKANGPFKSIEELTNVKGIGPKLFEKIKGEVTVGEAAPKVKEKASKVKAPTQKAPKGGK